MDKSTQAPTKTGQARRIDPRQHLGHPNPRVHSEAVSEVRQRWLDARALMEAKIRIEVERTTLPAEVAPQLQPQWYAVVSDLMSDDPATRQDAEGMADQLRAEETAHWQKLGVMR